MDVPDKDPHVALFPQRVADGRVYTGEVPFHTEAVRVKNTQVQVSG